MLVLNRIKEFFKHLWAKFFKRKNSLETEKDKKNYLGLIKDTILWSLIGAMFFIGTVLVISVFDFPGGIKLFVIESNSMEPTLKVGSIVLIKDKKEYVKEDVITFNTPVSEGSYKTHDFTTHRIVKKEKIEGVSFFTTKGDNNEENDKLRIDEKSIKGKVMFHLPFIGYVVNFAKNTKGFVFVIIIPAVILMYRELTKLKDNAVYLYKKRKEEKEKRDGNSDVNQKDNEMGEEMEVRTVNTLTQLIIKELSST